MSTSGNFDASSIFILDRDRCSSSGADSDATNVVSKFYTPLPLVIYKKAPEQIQVRVGAASDYDAGQLIFKCNQGESVAFVSALRALGIAWGLSWWTVNVRAASRI